MCLIKVKEEQDYTVPARVVRRREMSPPRRSTTRIILNERTPSPETSTYVVTAPEPSVAASEHRSEKPSRAPSLPPPPASTRGSTHTHSNFVRVEEDAESSSSSSEDVRSKSSKSQKSRHTRKTSGSNAPSEYDIKEREYRRERRFSPPDRIQEQRSRDEFDTYRYINAPRDRSENRRISYGDEPRTSSASYRRERERVVVVENDGRSRREYRQ